VENRFQKIFNEWSDKILVVLEGDDAEEQVVYET
jgi:hypothetical protein